MDINEECSSVCKNNGKVGEYRLMIEIWIGQYIDLEKRPEKRIISSNNIWLR
jgi:hypothetical protein